MIPAYLKTLKNKQYDRITNHSFLSRLFPGWLLRRQTHSKMTTTFKTTKELIESGDSPLPLEIISGKMGINLSAVEGISWTRMFDGQFVNITIHFNPFKEDYWNKTGVNPYPALSAPSARSLRECFKELKVGRPAGQQRYLDELIAELL